MTAFNYTRAKATADRLITRFGQPGTLQRMTTGGPAYNPNAAAPMDYPVVFLVTDYSLAEIDGSRILATDKRVYMAVRSLEIEPSTADQLVGDGAKPFSIVEVKPLQPGATTVLYELRCRR